MPTTRGIYLLGFLCFSNTGATLLANIALTMTNPALVSMAKSVDLSVSTIIEHAVFLGTMPRILENIGSLLILGSGILVPVVKFYNLINN